MRTLNAAHLGPTSYRDGLRIQEALVAAIGAGRTRNGGGEPVSGVSTQVAPAPPALSALGGDPAHRLAGGQKASGDWLLYPDHPPVLTVGRSPSEGNLKVPAEALEARGIEVFEVARGGDITWHGPGQLVGYTLCDLDQLGHDLHRFLRNIELGLIEALATWGIEGRRVEGRTGIWVGDDKIASIGVAVRRWVTYHGFALNVSSDLAGFDLIHPCGLHGIRMTTVAKLAGEKAPTLEEARRRTAETMATRLGYASPVWKPAEAAWNAAAGHLPSMEGDATPGNEVRSHELDSAGGQARPTAA